MEFRYVFILDGDWKNQKTDFQKEEERRLYYVGMTRAEKRRFLYLLKNSVNPHAGLLKDCGYVLQKNGAKKIINGYSEDLTISIIGMQDIFLSYPGRFDKKNPIHQAIKNISCGDKVDLIPNNGDVFICANNTKIGKLSKKGSAFWAGKTDQILNAKILAMVKRSKKDEEESGFGRNIKTDSWELPVVEVLHRL